MCTYNVGHQRCTAIGELQPKLKLASFFIMAGCGGVWPVNPYIIQSLLR